MGQNPLDIHRLWQEMWPRTRMYVSIRAISAVDIALWDLLGNLTKQPIYRLLGACRDKIPAYYSSEDLPSTQAYADQALEYKAKGWTAYKLHVSGNPAQLIEKCAAVRKAVGDNFTLMLDGSGRNRSFEDALRVGRGLEELKYFWYEDPLWADDMFNYVKLAHDLDIPIVATEDAPQGFFGLSRWITSGATDILRGDVTFKGGITALIKICHLAEAFRMKCEIHHGGNSTGDIANLHVAMAIDNCDFFEYMPPKTQQYGMVKDIEVDNQGFVHATTKSGLGFDIDYDLIKKNTTGVLT